MKGLRELRLIGTGWGMAEVGHLLREIAARLETFEVRFERSVVGVDELEGFIHGLRGDVRLRVLRVCGVEGTKLEGESERVEWVRLSMGRMKGALLHVELGELERSLERLLATAARG